MSKYLSKAISKINSKNTKTLSTQKATLASDDVHRVARRQPQLYKINRVPIVPRINMGRHFGSGGLA